MPDMGGALLHGIHDLQAGNEFASGVHTHFKLAIGHGFEALRKDFSATKDGV